MSPEWSSYDADQQPRKEPRRIVPAISMAIRVDFQATATPFIGRLWDVSASGACLLFPPTVPVEVGDQGAIIMYHPSIGEPIRSFYRVAWVDRLAHACYCGGVFTQRVNFETTFLATLMRSRDDNGGVQLTDLRNDLTAFPGFH